MTLEELEIGLGGILGRPEFAIGRNVQSRRLDL